MQKVRFSFVEILVWIISFCALFYNSGSFMCSANSTLGLVLLLVALIALLLQYRYINKKVCILCFSIFVGVLLNVVFVGNTLLLGTSIRFALVVIFSCIFACYIDAGKFVNFFVNIMVFLTVIGLVVHYVLNYIGNTAWLSSLPRITNANGVTVYNGIIFAVYTYSYSRLMSIFWEPSLYSTFVNIALICELYLKKEKNWLYVIAFVLGIWESKSTGGYIIAAIVLSFSLIANIRNRKVQGGLFAVMSCFFGYLYLNITNILSFLAISMPKVFAKLAPGSTNSSYTTRMDSGVLNMKIFFDHPIVGVGMGGVEKYYVELGGLNETSTLTYFLAAFGVVGIVFTIFYCYCFIKQKKFSLLMRSVLILVFTLILLKEPYWFSAGIYTFFFVFAFNDIEPNSISGEK